MTDFFSVEFIFEMNREVHRTDKVNSFKVIECSEICEAIVLYIIKKHILHVFVYSINI